VAVKIRTENIADTVHRLIKKYDERDPLKLAKAMNIIVCTAPMGIFDGACKGLFIMYCRKKHITINSDLPEDLQRVILAHELGHAVLHAKTSAVASFHDISMFDNSDVDAKEFEANIFAAELLLSDEDVLDALNESSFFCLASRLHVPYELLDFKFRLMKKKGFDLEAPIVSQGNFMKHLEKDFITE
jgi:Zn-dependent peptidase ImmA (M78 family)